MANQDTYRDEHCYWCGNLYTQKGTSRCGLKDRHVCGRRHAGSVARCELPLWQCKAEDAREKARRLNVSPAKLEMSALDVAKALRKHHSPRSMNEAPQWCVLEEVQIGSHYRASAAPPRRIDLLAINLWTSARRGYSFVAYEIKVSRSDFLLELKHPTKREPAIGISTQFYFATPPGLVKPEEIPEECGLVEASHGPRGALRVTELVPAPSRPVRDLSLDLTVCLARRLQETRGAA